MNVGNALLVCFALVGCGTATPEPRTPQLVGKGSATARDALPISGPDELRVARPDGQGSRLGPPSPRGLGLRRVDRAASTSAKTTRY
jgi:hypothetical protein